MRIFRRGVLLGASGALVIHCWHLAAVLACYCSWPAVALGAVLAGCAVGNFFREDPPADVRYRRPVGQPSSSARLELQPPEPAGRPGYCTSVWEDDGQDDRPPASCPEDLQPASRQPFRPPVIRPEDREWEFLRDRPPAAADNRPAVQDPAWLEFVSQHETAEEQP